MDNFNNRGHYQLRRTPRNDEEPRAGFTLLELIVVVAIFTIIIGASYALLNAGKTGSYSGDAKIGLQEELRQAMEVIVSELSTSAFTKVTIEGSGDSIRFQAPVEVDKSGSWEDIDSDEQDDFYLENTLDSSGNVRWGAYLRGEDHTAASSSREGRWVRFLLVGDELTRRVLDSNQTTTIEDFPLADNIQSVNFGRISNNVIRVNLQARKLTVDRHPIVYSLSTEVHLRSKV